MARHSGPVLVDTNVILESHRVGAWRALAGSYRVETVEDCVTETVGLYSRAVSDVLGGTGAGESLETEWSQEGCSGRAD